MRLRYTHLALLFVTLCSIPLASAQSNIDANIGFGSAWNKANGQGIENANSFNAFGSCTPNSGDVNCQATPALNGFFLGLGADIMLTKKFGVGAEVSFLPAHPDYGPLQYRQTFYDFNGIVTPLNLKRVEL